MLLFAFVYLLAAFLCVWPPAAFVSAGLTLPQLAAPLLGSERESFVRHHLRRTSLTLAAHACLPAGLVLGLTAVEGGLRSALGPAALAALWVAALTPPALVALRVARWRRRAWAAHPALAAAPDPTALMAAVDGEFGDRDEPALSLSAGPVARTVVTRRWIVAVDMYGLNLARHDEAALTASGRAAGPPDPARGYLSIEVRPDRAGGRPFTFVIDASALADLRARVGRPVVVPADVAAPRPVVDRFVDAFRAQVAENETHRVAEEPEPCVGCMRGPADVRLVRRCVAGRDGPDERPCRVCACRPMWCVECMARWFAARQDPDAPETWLGSKCTCPLCRRVFCVYDVCPVAIEPGSASE